MKSFTAISVAGVATVCMALLLDWYEGHSVGFQRPIDTKFLGISAIPTVLFLISLAASLGSQKLKRAVAISAVLIGTLFVCGTLLAMAVGLGHGTGLGGEIYVIGAWFLGTGLSAVILLVALTNYAWQSLRQSHPPRTDDSGRK